MGEIPPTKGEPSTLFKLPELVSTRNALMALACGTARKAFRPVVPLPPLLLLLLQLPSQASAHTSTKIVAIKPARLFPARLVNVIKSLL
jgi:hypothetical protein